MKKLTTRTPNKLMVVPKSAWRKSLYLHVTGDKFELAVMVATLLNLGVLALDHDNISEGTAEIVV